jgi:uncharacterized membrane protein YccC
MSVEYEEELISRFASTLVGCVLGVIEVAGLPERQEGAFKKAVRQSILDRRDAFKITLQQEERNQNGNIQLKD